MSEHVITIGETGDIESLYNDKVRLDDVGKATIERASHIVFNEALQLWDVVPVGYLVDTLPIQYTRFVSYGDAIKFEVAMLNEARKLGILGSLDSLYAAKVANSVYRELYEQNKDFG